MQWIGVPTRHREMWQTENHEEQKHPERSEGSQLELVQAKRAVQDRLRHMGPIQAACLFVRSKYKEMYGNIKESNYRELILSNVHVKAQNKGNSTLVVVYCHFCGSKW